MLMEHFILFTPKEGESFGRYRIVPPFAYSPSLNSLLYTLAQRVYTGIDKPFSFRSRICSLTSSTRLLSALRSSVVCRLFSFLKKAGTLPNSPETKVPNLLPFGENPNCACGRFLLTKLFKHLIYSLSRPIGFFNQIICRLIVFISIFSL